MSKQLKRDLNPSPTPGGDPPQASEFFLEPADNARLANLCGPCEEHLRQIERRLGVEINRKGSTFHVAGMAQAVRAAGAVLIDLYDETLRETLHAARVHLFLNSARVAAPDANATPADAVHILAIHTQRSIVRGVNPSQQRYMQNIVKHAVNFGVGPAGTGKTYLAVACAVEALERERVRRILLVRPAVEAGERLGFLPGDLTQKIDPYLRPLYDALYEMLGFERVGKLIERNVIELAPLAYMRGRTLNEAFIILDEAQNTTVEQMKMFLTRLGFGSTAVITGDMTQVDLPRERKSGLRHAVDVLKGVEGISFSFFKVQDVVRHELVQRIVSAYEAAEAAQDASASASARASLAPH